MTTQDSQSGEEGLPSPISQRFVPLGIKSPEVLGCTWIDLLCPTLSANWNSQHWKQEVQEAG